MIAGSVECMAENYDEPGCSANEILVMDQELSSGGNVEPNEPEINIGDNKHLLLIDKQDNNNSNTKKHQRKNSF